MDGDINEAQFDAAAVHDTNLLSCPIPAVAIPTSYYLAICLSSSRWSSSAAPLRCATKQIIYFGSAQAAAPGPRPRTQPGRDRQCTVGIQAGMTLIFDIGYCDDDRKYMLGTHHSSIIFCSGILKCFLLT